MYVLEDNEQGSMCYCTMPFHCCSLFIDSILRRADPIACVAKSCAIRWSHPSILFTQTLWIMNKSIRYAVCAGRMALSVRLLGRCSRFCETTVFFHRCQQKDNQIEIPGQTEDSLLSLNEKMQAVNLLLGWTHDLELYDFSHSLHRSPNHSHLVCSHLQRQILKYAHCRAVAVNVPCSTTQWHQTSYYHSQSQYANQFIGVFGLYSYVLRQLYAVVRLLWK